MIEKLSNKLADWLISKEVINIEEKELYSYAAYSAVLFVSPIFIALAFGIYLNMIPQCLLIIMPLMLIRKFSGGFHAKSLRNCLICSILLFYLCIFLANHINSSIWVILITVIAIISITCFSPIENDNRKLDVEEKIKYKKIAVMMSFICLMISILMKLINMYEYHVCVSLGIILTAGLQIPCIPGLYSHGECAGKIASEPRKRH